MKTARRGYLAPPRMSPRTLIFAALFLLAAAPATAQTPQRSPYVNGPVSSLLLDGDTLYVGGTFTVAGTAAGPLSFVSPDDGRVLRSQPGFSGRGDVYWWKNIASLQVHALLADGAGGWYAGGLFVRVDGRPRGSLVHLLPDGSVDPEFHVELTGTVRALARHGATLWVGGEIGELGGQHSEDLVALDAATGTPTGVDPFNWRSIDDLEVSGDRLYVAGMDGLISLDARTGQRDGWPTLPTDVKDVAVRDGIVYIAGDERVYGSETTGAVALRESDASLVTQFPITSGDAIELGDGVVIIRGSFRSKYGRTLGAFDPVTGADRGWFRDVIGYGSAGQIAIAGTRLYAAELEGVPGGFASFDLRDGSHVPWSPPLLGGRFRTLTAGNGIVAIGGDQAAVNGVARSNLAAFDLQTGAVKPFAPELRVNDGPFDPIVNPYVSTLRKVGGVLYAGGSFHTAGGVRQHNLAALDPVSGARLPFPETSAAVHDLAAAGDTLYVGGARGTLGGVQTDGLGAVSLATGAALPWAPAMGCDVDALAIAGATLHAGGCFGLRHYRERAEIAGPAVTGRVWTLLADATGGVWAGGEFAGGNIAHFGADGAPLVDAPVTDGPVYALALDGTTLHVGGHFTRAAGRAAHPRQPGQARGRRRRAPSIRARPTRSRRSPRCPAAGSRSAAGSTRPGTRRPVASPCSATADTRARRARSAAAPAADAGEDRRASLSAPRESPARVARR